MAKCDCGEEFHNQIKLEEHKVNKYSLLIIKKRIFYLENKL
jgi:hypothetical protein